MSSRALLIGATAAVAAPSALLLGVGVIVGAGAGSSGGAAGAAAMVCTYAYPHADQLAATMARLTPEPVQASQWDRYASLIGVDPATTPWDQSTPEQRAKLLPAAVQSLLYTNTPAAITTPPLIWWHGIVPDDTDNTWQATPVPGWDGTLDTYLTALLDDYATNPDTDWSEHQCIPPAATACGQPAEMSAILATIRHMESGGNYLNQKYAVATRGRDSSGNATGAYAFTYPSWGGYGGYAEAFMAPPDVQDAKANEYATSILADYGGDPSWVPISWYVGPGGARKVQDGTWSLAYIPNPQFNRLSIGEYQSRWLDHYTTIALPAAGGTVAECPQAGAAAVAWGETQLGAPYAAANRYRFGEVPFPGGTIIGDRGNRYTFPAGTLLYDCSGFVIRAWREAGVDLRALYGLYGSQQFPSSPLEEIDRSALAPGDLAVYSPVDGVGHIVMIHHVDPDGTVHIIEATPSKGVHIGLINWGRVTSIKRPANPSG